MLSELCLSKFILIPLVTPFVDRVSNYELWHDCKLLSAIQLEGSAC
jgi:hypothetical protein